MRELRTLFASAAVASCLALVGLAGCGMSQPRPIQIPEGDGPGTLGGAVSDDPYCDDVADWDAQWAAYEDAVLRLVNERRALGADCGGTVFPPAGPLSMNDALRCAARNHSMDMGERNYFDHYSPEGEGPSERLDQAGYHGSTWGENIAWGYSSPEDVVAGWMGSPGHCSNIMNAAFTETGVGYYDGSLWTQTFGRP